MIIKNNKLKRYENEKVYNGELVVTPLTSFLIIFKNKILKKTGIEYLVDIETDNESHTVILDSIIMSNVVRFKELMYSIGMILCNIDVSSLAQIIAIELQAVSLRSVEEVKTIGYHKGKYVTTNGIINETGLTSYSSSSIALGICYRPTQLDSSNTSIISPQNPNENLIYRAILEMNNQHLDGLFALAYIQSCLYATKIHKKIGFFPMLFVSGQRRSGKNKLIKTILKVLGIDSDGDGLPNTTKVGLNRRLSQLVDFPYWIDEYSSDTKSTSKADDTFRSAFNRSVSAKGTKNPDKMVNIVPTASLIVSGESMPTDSATRDRFITIELSSKKKSLKPLNVILDNNELMSRLGYMWMVEACQVDFPTMWEDIKKQKPIVTKGDNSRLADSYLIVSYFFERITEQINISKNQVEEFLRKQIIIENADRDSTDMITGIWDTLLLLLNNNQIKINRDIKILGDELYIYFGSFWNEKSKMEKMTASESRLSKQSIVKYLEQNYTVEHRTSRVGDSAKRCMIFLLSELPRDIRDSLLSYNSNIYEPPF